MWKRVVKFLKILGPGVITGAADDDPSGIATYSQAGAQFGLGVSWVNLYLLPFQAAVQEACARIGAVTGKGIVAVIKQHYAKQLVWVVVMLVVTANIINIGANIGAMAEALNLIIPFNFVIYTILFTLIILTLEICTSYRVYSRVLKYLAITLLIYPLTLFVVGGGEWGEILLRSITPWIEWSPAFFLILMGIAGTTISPYMFFWQAGEEVEEEKSAHLIKNGHPHIGKVFMQHLRTDNMIGMVMSAVAAWAIVTLAAVVLFPQGLTEIKTAADAAVALEPLVASFANAGFIAKLLFAGGIISLGLLSVPVLSGSAAYAVSEAMNMREGLDLKFGRARGFYTVMVSATLVGLGINYLGIDPMKALLYTAVINGMVAVPLLIIIAKVGENGEIMGEYRSGKLSSVLVWATIVIMGVGAVGTVWRMIV